MKFWNRMSTSQTFCHCIKQVLDLVVFYTVYSDKVRWWNTCSVMQVHQQMSLTAIQGLLRAKYRPKSERVTAFAVRSLIPLQPSPWKKKNQPTTLQRDTEYLYFVNTDYFFNTGGSVTSPGGKSKSCRHLTSFTVQTHFYTGEWSKLKCSWK